jgi:5-methyltetrahydropteroyltriglutamate--homocysteine methyltransferase
MFTVTENTLLPTTVTGSWPRPAWYRANMRGRRFSHCMLDREYREQFTDATSVVVSDQEFAGLDIISNGDYHLDTELAGQSWLRYPLERCAGLSEDEFPAASGLLRDYPPGTLLHEILVRGWMWPRVIGPLAPRIPFEFARLWELAQARTERPVKFGTISAQTLIDMIDVDSDAYPSKRKALWDMATLINRELRALADAGCRVIQLEEPAIHAVAAANPDDPELEFLIEVFNHEVEGLEDVEVWAHTCWGNPNMQKVYTESSYAPSVEIFMERLNIDVWTIESKDNGGEALPHLAKYRDSDRVKIALGAVSHRTLEVDTPADVAVEIRHALEYVRPEMLIVTSDCGFGRDGCNRAIALYKAAAIALGADIVRQELGGEPRRIPIAQERMPVLRPRT